MATIDMGREEGEGAAVFNEIRSRYTAITDVRLTSTRTLHVIRECGVVTHSSGDVRIDYINVTT